MTDKKIKTLYRSEKDKMLAGICAGLAKYFDMDVTLMRVLWVIATFTGLPTLLVYIVMWFVIPTESEVGKEKGK